MIIAETPRLLLRNFHLLDAAVLTRVFADAEVMRFGPGVQTSGWIQQWLRNYLEIYYQSWGFGLWAVVEKSSRTAVGYCGLSYDPDIDGQPEIQIGYRLARSVWGRGYATEAVCAVRDYGFNVLCLPRLIAMIDPLNTASLRVAEKAGMRYEKEIMLAEYSHPDHIYAMIKPHHPPGG